MESWIRLSKPTCGGSCAQLERVRHPGYDKQGMRVPSRTIHRRAGVRFMMAMVCWGLAWTTAPAQQTMRRWEPGQPIFGQLMVSRSGEEAPPLAVRSSLLAESPNPMTPTDDIIAAPGEELVLRVVQLSDLDAYEDVDASAADQSVMQQLGAGEEADLARVDEWRASGGTLAEPSGSLQQRWQVPESPGHYTVTVRLDDEAILGPHDGGNRDDTMVELATDVTVFGLSVTGPTALKIGAAAQPTRLEAKVMPADLPGSFEWKLIKGTGKAKLAGEHSGRAIQVIAMAASTQSDDIVVQCTFTPDPDTWKMLQERLNLSPDEVRRIPWQVRQRLTADVPSRS